MVSSLGRDDIDSQTDQFQNIIQPQKTETNDRDTRAGEGEHLMCGEIGDEREGDRVDMTCLPSVILFKIGLLQPFLGLNL